MHYFTSWTEESVLNMSFEKFNMYLATIPDFTADKEEGETSEKQKEAPQPTGSFNLFDLDQR